MKHIGIVAVSAEGAALCYRTICLEKVFAHLPPGRAGQVLDAGSGLGHFLGRLPAGVDAHAVDLSRGNLQHLQRTWAREADGAHLWNASIEALPFTDSQFDVAYSFSVLWYVAGWRRGDSLAVRAWSWPGDPGLLMPALASYPG